MKSPILTTSMEVFLDLEMVREARLEEFAGYLKMQVYCRVWFSQSDQDEVGRHK